MAKTPKQGPADEKITINLSPVDLGTIDLLVSEGHYSSRSDLIRAAIRRTLDEHRPAVQEVVMKRQYTIGAERYSRASLQRLRDEGTRVHAKIVGVVSIAKDVEPELADQVFDGIRVFGAIKASKPVLERLGDRVQRGFRDDAGGA